MSKAIGTLASIASQLAPSLLERLIVEARALLGAQETLITGHQEEFDRLLAEANAGTRPEELVNRQVTVRRTDCCDDGLGGATVSEKGRCEFRVTMSNEEAGRLVLGETVELSLRRAVQ